ncbi:uncharacterized protein Z518_04618 [Rhinocladiella mackenziei CBS 650.93]|uniref:Rhinocladiella mackenziei CBS 650.93 unplaced genomic scaffold supercont1.3, whole genome shotgun sequence n=1 Tax=Rhinocladiella mackenziei CBS 650.93 TaxID=1442369 RepID=A0A0D2FWM9_9EURO|nr:uncharacterized protein Z518_04618 [Rhinocladiella mackenziei CBS 650.93]KIX06642.1 hypothetical protein Z518_04618 [Rhinocladiella mackenziei CBS 650.93]
MGNSTFISLFAAHQSTTDVDAQIKFYEDFGFVVDRGYEALEDVPDKFYTARGLSKSNLVKSVCMRLPADPFMHLIMYEWDNLSRGPAWPAPFHQIGTRGFSMLVEDVGAEVSRIKQEFPEIKFLYESMTVKRRWGKTSTALFVDTEGIPVELVAIEKGSQYDVAKVQVPDFDDMQWLHFMLNCTNYDKSMEFYQSFGMYHDSAVDFRPGVGFHPFGKAYYAKQWMDAFNFKQDDLTGVGFLRSDRDPSGMHLELMKYNLAMEEPSSIPDFDSLPAVDQMPRGCAWGVFDRGDQKDHFGCLNLLTPAVVSAAGREVRDGVSISLNWPLDAIRIPPFGRKALGHTVHAFKDTPYDTWSFEDEVEFNTQSSSQWDSLNELAPGGALPTLEHWHGRGGVVGRGVLLDYRAWAARKGIQYSCFESHTIGIEDLEAIAADQKTQLKHGDILIVRSGYTEDLMAADSDRQQAWLNGGRAVGVEGTVKAAKWFWNHHFAAVAGDMLAFEVTPPRLEAEDGREGAVRDLVLHQYFLSLFGLHIGELWDLKALADTSFS